MWVVAMQLTLIAKKNCKPCEDLKAELIAEGTEFEVVVFDDLPKEEKRRIAKIGRDNGHAYLPMLFDGENLIR